MKLPIPNLDFETKLAEFDIWITPSIGEIKDTERFLSELERVSNVFDILSSATNDFEDVEHCDSQAIATTFTTVIATKSEEESQELLRALASVLFLVTGKSDNNAKCQLPIHLRDVAGWKDFPTTRRANNQVTLSTKKLPRELKADKVVKAIVGLDKFAEVQKKLLHEFIRFVLNDEQNISQLWSIGRSFCMLREFGKSKDLLTPIVVFQVRGSVSASGGHVPEDMLRERMIEWGMIRATDFNEIDVVVAEEGSGRRKKTRAYDFVLPYQTEGWEHRIFVQCQFYAGDSGSVSHKNVDQAAESRRKVTELHNRPVFIEYVDGAGYYASLNGDLKNLFSMDNTSSFFQVRSAGIRLRRHLQEIGFLMPLEIEHAILRTDGSTKSVTKLLVKEGYKKDEISRALTSALKNAQINAKGEVLSVCEERLDIVRRYFLIDIVACFGSPPANGKLTGSLLVPGYGPFFGMKLDDLAKKAMELSECLREDWGAGEVLEDIRWLCDEGISMSC